MFSNGVAQPSVVMTHDLPIKPERFLLNFELYYWLIEMWTPTPTPQWTANDPKQEERRKLATKNSCQFSFPESRKNKQNKNVHQQNKMSTAEINAL